VTRTIAIRPEPGLTATLAEGRAAGLDMAGWPLFELRALAWEAPAPASIDALLIGSASAIRFGGSALTSFQDKPVHAVGEATAKAAREAGFTVASVGEGGLQKLLGQLATRPMRLLRIAGAEHVPLVAPEGIALETRTAYRSFALPMPAEMAEMLGDGAMVLLHSAAAACHFAAECDRLGVRRNRVALAALGPRIARAAGSGWERIRSAEVPRESAILALARDMCH
jgi:uroporphyrinogen-III synthase